ncbi:hypothetical protein MRX96_034206 [Rhipicephalus microplus]
MCVYIAASREDDVKTEMFQGDNVNNPSGILAQTSHTFICSKRRRSSRQGPSIGFLRDEQSTSDGSRCSSGTDGGRSSRSKTRPRDLFGDAGCRRLFLRRSILRRRAHQFASESTEK